MNDLLKKSVVVLNSYLCGIIFAIGLGISGMMNTVKIRNFLDLTGTWDPSLAFVMGAAVLVTGVLFPLVTGGMACPLGEDEFILSKRTAITPSLVIGSSIFGIGWAFSGLCPGPALSNTFLGGPQIFAFLGMMAVGLLLTNFYKFQ